MKPPHDITPKFLNLIGEVSEKFGEVKGCF